MIKEEDVQLAAAVVAAELNQLVKAVSRSLPKRVRRPKNATPYDCPFCGDAIKAGEKITRLKTIWVHERCREARSKK